MDSGNSDTALPETVPRHHDVTAEVLRALVGAAIARHPPGEELRHGSCAELAKPDRQTAPVIGGNTRLSALTTGDVA
jgi:hypothetical protein